MTLVRDKLVTDNLDIECKIDDVPFSYITGLSYKHIVDAARVVKIRIGGIEPIANLHIGSEVILKAGRGETTHNLDFIGIVTQINPSFTESEITAVDYITHLQSSEIVNYKEQDLIGKDLYYLAADACNYKNIDTSQLLEGSGIKATRDMGLSGFQSRRRFIKKCFDFLTPINKTDEYSEAVALQWRYGIRRNNVMDFWLEDHKNFKSEPILTITENNNTLTGPGIVSDINSTQMINSATYLSSVNTDVFATASDEDSIERHGVYGKLYTSTSERLDRLEELAYTTILLHKEPTVTYNIMMNNGEYIMLGDYIKVKVSTHDKGILLPVVQLSHVITDRVESIITVGTPELSITEYISSSLD
tara:strand:- start:342 stop:1424 length:1083 start_codon:yes stop_codon:yes gene_type:complete